MKNKLTCSICLKEFKSLPALNGHMRSHGGVRASPNFKQVAVHFTSVFDSLLSMLMFATLCHALLCCENLFSLALFYVTPCGSRNAQNSANLQARSLA